MPESPPNWTTLQARQANLLAAGAARMDAVGWHYTQVLAARAQQQTGPAQALLCAKLATALAQLEAKLAAAAQRAAQSQAATATPSALAALLHDMASPMGGTADDTAPFADRPNAWPNGNPRVQQFRKQLGQIRVQKQVSQAIAQAPQNAGPINSHMLVLRSLGVMRAVSPDYLNRFMGYVDTLLCLDAAGQGKLPTKKTSAATKTTKP